jgi:NADPH-dependent ferric siderophore reductase
MMHETIAFPARATRPVWPLVVVAARDVTPRMRRVSLVGEALERFSWRAGQDLVFSLPQAGGGVARRHYTIRAFDRQELRLEVDVVLHGASPGARWASTAKIGDPVTAEGPRGRTVVSGRADWHLFTGDETALPAIAAMIESVPAGARAHAIIEVEAPDEEQAIASDARVEIEWLHRRGPPAAASPALIERLAAFQPPPGAGHAYIIGETATVRAQRQGLIARGFAKEQITAEGYWRPGRVGGHDHIIEFGWPVGRRERGERGRRRHAG